VQFATVTDLTPAKLSGAGRHSSPWAPAILTSRQRCRNQNWLPRRWAVPCRRTAAVDKSGKRHPGGEQLFRAGGHLRFVGHLGSMGTNVSGASVLWAPVRWTPTAYFGGPVRWTPTAYSGAPVQRRPKAFCGAPQPSTRRSDAELEGQGQPSEPGTDHRPAERSRLQELIRIQKRREAGQRVERKGLWSDAPEGLPRGGWRWTPGRGASHPIGTGRTGGEFSKWVHTPEAGDSSAALVPKGSDRGDSQS